MKKISKFSYLIEFSDGSRPKHSMTRQGAEEIARNSPSSRGHTTIKRITLSSLFKRGIK